MAELAPDVVCEFPTAPGAGPRSATGIDANRTLYGTLRPMWATFTLTRTAVHPVGDDPHRVLAEFVSDGTLLDGTAYRNTYLAVGTIHNGKITHWQEFSDPAPLDRGVKVLQAVAAADAATSTPLSH